MNRNIDEAKPYNPDVDMSYGYRSAAKILQTLYRLITSERHNRTLYQRLYEQLMRTRTGGDPSVPFSNLRVEIVPGQFIPVYLYLMNTGKSAAGTFGSKKQRWSFPSSRITIGLYGDPDEEIIQWTDDYESTLDHEIHHAYQALAVGDRLLQKQHKDKNYQGTAKERMKAMAIVGGHKGTSRFSKDEKGQPLTDPVKKLQGKILYYRNPAEMGANAHALLRQLTKAYGADSMEVLGNHVRFNRPSFKEINDSLLRETKFNSKIWNSLTALSQHERALLGISREEDTEGWKLRHELLKVTFDIYKRHYKR